MLFHDVLNLGLANIAAQLWHGVLNVPATNKPSIICVELLEDWTKLFVALFAVQEFRNVKGCCKELAVVYFSIAQVVDLFYNLICLFLI